MMEVRCCCDGHLIGYMAGVFEEGRDYRFLLAPITRVGDGRDYQIVNGDQLTMRCLMWGGTLRPALQSKDYPLDLLRRIDGFHEIGDRC